MLRAAIFKTDELLLQMLYQLYQAKLARLNFTCRSNGRASALDVSALFRESSQAEVVSAAADADQVEGCVQGWEGEV